MTEPTLTASYRVIERVRQKISTQWVQASDTRISKLLGISRTSVSAYKHGRDVMSIDTLARAQEILELPGPELAALSIELSKEGTKNPGALKVLEAMLEAVRGHAASILLGAVGLITALQVFDLSSHSEALAGFGLIDFVCIMRIRSGARKALVRLVYALGIKAWHDVSLPALGTGSPRRVGVDHCWYTPP